MDDLVAEFLVETNESLDELDADIITLEQNPNDQGLISQIFRLMHTIKGTCGFLGLPRLEKLAHHAENVLGRYRDGDLEVTQDSVTLILASIDRIKLIVTSLEETGAEPDADNMDLITRLDEVYEGKVAGADSGETGGGGDTADETQSAEPEADEHGFVPVRADQMAETMDAASAEPEPDEHGFVPVPASAMQDDAPAEAAPEVAAEAPPTPAPEPVAKPEPAAAKAPTKEAPTVTQTLRVNVDVLENLMTMVSELVLTRNQLMQIMRSQSGSDFSGPLQRLNHVVSELQDGVMKTRMQPIGNAWNKLPRIIRDLAMELGKKIDLQMHGQDTELDRQVLELIKDPLTHMIRNSADHGIEMPADRLAAGKPEMGTVTLRAYHEGGHILIKIADDGKGLPAEKIKEKILEKGLATQEQLDEMSTQQIQQYIFHAGFSTAAAVTSVSGRGVGMDVVRTNIEKIGGMIELKSTEGQGSTFTIKIPLTLAIVSALIVEAEGQKFAIPQLSVRELVMTSANSSHTIESIKGSPVLRLRDRLLPLVSLTDLLKLSHDKLSANNNDSPDEGEGDESSSPSNQYIVVAEVAGYSFGIIVDRVFDTEEIVVKPVARILKDLDLFSGNTILGDGSVIMILDPNGIARSTGEIDNNDAHDAHQEELVATSDNKTSLLLFKASDNAPKAVPLSLIARLEQIDLSKVENSGGKMMIQYRDELMPLIPFNSEMVLGETGEKPVLVFHDKGQTMGVIVDEIIDIKEEHINVQVKSDDEGLIGSAIIGDHATDIVDVASFVMRHDKNWYKDHGDEAYQKDSANGSAELLKKRVLLVDDSSFFRNMLTPILSVAGYRVTAMESPIEALQSCEKGERFDIIISDIEMPDMDGFEFAEKVQETASWQSTPMLALSSHVSPEDIDRGKSVGFRDYIAKFDRDKLLDSISHTLIRSQGEAA